MFLVFLFFSIVLFFSESGVANQNLYRFLSYNVEYFEDVGERRERNGTHLAGSFNSAQLLTGFEQRKRLENLADESCEITEVVVKLYLSEKLETWHFHS